MAEQLQYVFRLADYSGGEADEGACACNVPQIEVIGMTVCTQPPGDEREGVGCSQ